MKLVFVHFHAIIPLEGCVEISVRVKKSHLKL